MMKLIEEEIFSAMAKLYKLLGIIAAHGDKTALLTTPQPVQFVLLPAPVIETTCAFELVERVLNPKKKNITKL